MTYAFGWKARRNAMRTEKVRMHRKVQTTAGVAELSWSERWQMIADAEGFEADSLDTMEVLPLQGGVQ